MTSFAEKKWSSDDVLQLKRRGSNEKDGYFKIQIEFGDDVYWIQTDFDFEKKTATYYTTTPTGGKKKGFYLPSKLTNVIDENFIKVVEVDKSSKKINLNLSKLNTAITFKGSSKKYMKFVFNEMLKNNFYKV